MRSTHHLSWLLIALALTCQSACRHEEVPPPESPAERIIALAPSVTETLFMLGLENRVVGVGDYSTWPPAAAAKPRLGGLFDARLEAITTLRPDLAILLPSEEKLRVQLMRLGVEVLTVRSETLADVEEMVRTVARRCRVEERGEELLQQWQAQLAPDAVQRQARVLLSVNRRPGDLGEVLVSGRGTHLHELLQRLGVHNVMSEVPMAYPQVGLEEIVQRWPDVVIELQGAPGNYGELIADWHAVGDETDLDPVCVRVVVGDHVLIPGPRLPRLYDELRRAIDSCGGTP
jgi:iron complex transport system substrate-binding protein